MQRSVKVAFWVVMVSLAAGVLGYHYTEELSWIDALLNASMILGGMGPVDVLHTDNAKLFASFYALYSCFMVLGLFTVLMGPVMHRVLHKFHADREEKKPKK